TDALAIQGERPADEQHSGEGWMHAGAAGRRYNAVSDFVDANVERGLTDKIAFTDPQRTLTYGELQAATCRFGRGLQALGLRQESRIVLILLDTVDFPIAFWGAIRAGIIPIPLNTMLAVEQYAYMLEDSRAEVLVVSAPLVKLFAPILGGLTQLRCVVVAGAEAASATPELGKLKTHAFADVLARGTPELWTAPTVA